MTTFVLVPGGWCGAWAYEAVEPLLLAAGHDSSALTLSGLDPADDDRGRDAGDAPRRRAERGRADADRSGQQERSRGDAGSAKHQEHAGPLRVC